MASLTRTPEWQALAAHHRQAAHLSMREQFAADPQRFAKFSLRLGDLLLDYSKNRVTEETLRLLLDLARAADIEGWRDRMFKGDAINFTEGRAVLHVALRAPADQAFVVDGENVMPKVAGVRAQMRAFTEAVRNGANGRAPAVGQSATSSTSASAAPTSAPPWRPRR